VDLRVKDYAQVTRYRTRLLRALVPVKIFDLVTEPRVDG
jgi:hypothetical protein